MKELTVHNTGMTNSIAYSLSSYYIFQNHEILISFICRYEDNTGLFTGPLCRFHGVCQQLQWHVFGLLHDMWTEMSWRFLPLPSVWPVCRHMYHTACRVWRQMPWRQWQINDRNFKRFVFFSNMQPIKLNYYSWYVQLFRSCMNSKN